MKVFQAKNVSFLFKMTIILYTNDATRYDIISVHISLMYIYIFKETYTKKEDLILVLKNGHKPLEKFCRVKISSS